MTVYELTRLDIVGRMSKKDCSYGYEETNEGYFDSPETAIAQMNVRVAKRDPSYEKIPFAWIITGRKIKTKTSDYTTNDYDSIRTFDGLGDLICIHDYDEGFADTVSKPFAGRTDWTTRFDKGEIVFILGRHNRINPAIVVAPPYSAKEWKERFGDHVSDATDDSYLVYLLVDKSSGARYTKIPHPFKPGETYVDTHDHPLAPDVFPARSPVFPAIPLVIPEEAKKELKDRLTMMEEINDYVAENSSDS